MATTTNYSWTTPDDTALVKDGASAIRTLGSSVDTTLKNLNPSTTLGDIEYRSSSANVNTRLPIGTTGQILTVSGGVPAWQSPAGGGKVLQVVSSYLADTFSTTSSSWVSTGLSASITPSSTSSKVLCIVSFVFSRQNGGGNATYLGLDDGAGNDRLLPNSPGSRVPSFWGTYPASITWNEMMLPGHFSYLHSPASTSSQTYRLRALSQFGDAIYLNRMGGTDSNDGGWGRGTSSIVLMEIGA